jgi:hypothetical protein
MPGGPLEPCSGLGLIKGRANPVAEGQREDAFPDRVVILSGLQVEAECTRRIPVDAISCLVEQAEADLGQGKASVGGFPLPGSRLRWVGRTRTAGFQVQAIVGLRPRVVLFRGFPGPIDSESPILGNAVAVGIQHAQSRFGFRVVRLGGLAEQQGGVVGIPCCGTAA